MYDEAAVLVGNCKTVDDANRLQHQVKRIHPEALKNLPSIYNWRINRGLSRAIITVNPLLGAQALFPGRAVPLKPGQTIDPSVVTAGFETAHKPDPLLKRMNQGPRSLYKCPGPWVLQVMEFAGRNSLDPNDPNFKNPRFLGESPLATAIDEAEKVAEGLSKSKFIDQKIHAYVFHDRTSSRVFLGPFQSPEDPLLVALLSKSGPEGLRPFDWAANELVLHKFTNRVIFPAGQLTAVPKEGQTGQMQVLSIGHLAEPPRVVR
jgi:hypothetical protein